MLLTAYVREHANYLKSDIIILVLYEQSVSKPISIELIQYQEILRICHFRVDSVLGNHVLMGAMIKNIFQKSTLTPG